MTHEDEWPRQTYERLLMLIGGAENQEDLDRTRALFAEFNHFFPQAKPQWDAYCDRMGVKSGSLGHSISTQRD